MLTWWRLDRREARCSWSAAWRQSFELWCWLTLTTGHRARVSGFRLFDLVTLRERGFSLQIRRSRWDGMTSKREGCDCPVRTLGGVIVGRYVQDLFDMEGRQRSRGCMRSRRGQRLLRHRGCQRIGKPGFLQRWLHIGSIRRLMSLIKRRLNCKSGSGMSGLGRT